MNHEDLKLILWFVSVLEFFGILVLVWFWGYFAGKGKMKGWEKNGGA